MRRGEFGRGDGRRRSATSYSPGECCGTIVGTVCGDPDAKHIPTRFVERQNLTMRMSMRRFTRLTNGFSRKVANHACAVALHYMFYNFGRIHKTLRVYSRHAGRDCRPCLDARRNCRARQLIVTNQTETIREYLPSFSGAVATTEGSSPLAHSTRVKG
jgi:hypothetical protein